jgi:hypothetical protein
MNPGRLFFGSFLLAKQKKGTSRRATPGSVKRFPLPTTKNTYGANCFAWCTPPVSCNKQVYSGLFILHEQLEYYKLLI